MASERNTDALIIGAGISGLACAHFCRAAGVGVQVVDPADRPGGVIETRRRDGYLYEIGPNSTMNSKPGLDRLIDEIGLSDRRVFASPEAKNRFVLRDGELRALPTSPPAMVKTKLFSTKAKWRIVGELFVRPRRDDADESVADFVRRRLGAEFLDYAIGPFVSGVYAGDPERLSLQSAFPPMYDFERRFGGIFKGAFRSAKERKARRGDRGPAQLLSFDGGMSVLTDHLAERHAGELRLGTPVTSIARDGEGWRARLGDGTELRAGSVVISAPARVASKLVAAFDSDLSERLGAVPYAPVASVFLGYDRSRVSHPLDGFGFLVPAVERREILGTIFSSTLFPGRAPDGKVALTVFVGGIRRPESVALDDGALMDLVRAELADLIGADGEPEFSHIFRWDNAIPQYTIGHRDFLAAVGRAQTENPGLFFCSNYTGGVSVGDCVDQAVRVAEGIAGTE